MADGTVSQILIVKLERENAHICLEDARISEIDQQ